MILFLEGVISVIEAMKEIGEYAIDGELTQNVFLENTCLNLPTKIYKNNKNYKQHVVILDFNTKDKKVIITFEEIDEKISSRKYLYIGNSRGNKPQISITTNNIKYIFSNTLPLLNVRAEGKLSIELNEILNSFFSKKTIEVKKKKVEYYYIKPDVFSFPDKLLDDLKEKENKVNEASTKKNSENEIEALITSLEKALIHSISSLSKEEIFLYTVAINGELICQMDEYKKIIFDEKISALFQKTNKNYKSYYQDSSICSVCGSEGETTSNSTNLEFKFYNVDNKGFSSRFDEKFTKNYNICKNCYQFLMISEKFIGANLKSKIGNLSCYIIPSFIQTNKDFSLVDFSEEIKETTNSIVNLESVEKSINKTQKMTPGSRNNFTVSYLFYVPSSKNDFKILKFIKDVSPYRLEKIQLNLNIINNLIENKYEDDFKLKLDLNKIWSCIPVKGKQGDSSGYEGTSRYLTLIDSIFSDRKINAQSLISQFNEVIRIIKFERPGYNIKSFDSFSFFYKILQSNFLLLFLMKLNLLEGFYMTDATKVDVTLIQNMLPEQILDYWNNIEIYEDNQRKALFLLGYMIGEIGASQSSKEIKNKPILNKINFQGMGIEKLMRLANEIPEKLRQYGKLSSNENINTAFRVLFESNIKNWKLSNQENVFYVLSGYSYSNYISWISWNKYKKSIEELFAKKLGEVSELKESGISVEIYEELLDEARKLIYGEIKDYKKSKNLLTQISVDK